MTMLTVRPENGRVSFPRFSNLFENLFENEFNTLTNSQIFKTPVLVNVKDTKDSYLIEVAAPGFTKENFNIKVDGSLLSLSGEKEEEENIEGQKFTRKEFKFSSFNRSFTLPKTVDATKISATYEGGILTVILPKKEEVKVASAFDIKVS